MQRSINWSYRPYKPYFFETGDIYICRIAPGKEYIHFEWLDDNNEVYNIYYRKRGEGEYTVIENITGSEYTLNELEDFTDYEFYLESGGKKSRVRLAKTGEAVGVVINYLHPDDEVYSYSGRALCSPSFVRHPDGFLLASMDLYGPSTPQILTLIYRSDDDGKTWHYVSELAPCFWGTLFIHKGEVYIVATSTEYGDLLIGKSSDGGKTFSAPTVLLRGSSGFKNSGVHKNAQAVTYVNGRIYFAFEWGAWAKGYHAAAVASCDQDADLLDAENWAITHPVMYDESWEGVAKGPSSGCIEGSVVEAPDGKLYNIMRYDTTKTVPSHGLVLAFEIDQEDPYAPLKYSHAIKLDGNLSKFMVKRDPHTGVYYTMIARITDERYLYDRRLLSLMKSTDLENWELVLDVLDRRDCDPKEVGFNYIAFEFEGDDIIFHSRTAINDAHNYHDANYQTFHKIKNFRDNPEVL